MARNLKMLAVMALVGLVTAACSSGEPVTPGGSSPVTGAKALSGAGATFPAPLYQRWAAEYKTKTGVEINYQAIGSGGGIAQITAKTVDFGASDAPMKPEELTAAPGIIHIPTVFGSVAVTYKLSGVATGLKLTGETLANIFLRKIKKWNDAAIKADNSGVSLPSTAITVVHRSDGSGTTNTFTSYLDTVSSEWHTKIGKGKEVAWPAGELGGQGNDGVSGQVKATPGAIGYIELAFAQKNNLPVAAIKNKEGKFVEPTLASTTAAAASAQVPDDLRFSIINAPGADSYPIATPTWLLVYQQQTDQAKGKALVDFLWWAVHDGQQFAEQLLYAKLPAELVTKDEAKIRSITFNGTALYTG